MNKTLILLALVIFCLAIGSISALMSMDSLKDWYPAILKPSWNPPNYLFGPVWTSLYIMMGIAMWLVIFSQKAISKKTAIRLFMAQLFFNFWWSPLFFKYHFLGWALFEILVLLFLIVLTALEFKKHHNGAFWLLTPYILWVTFASYLNYTLWKLNA